MQVMFRFLIIAQEPAPYKTDLFNAFPRAVGWDTTVFHVCSKDWSPEGSHSFSELPQIGYREVICKGKGWIGELVSIARMIRLFVAKNDLLMICGYSKPSLVCAILLSIIRRIPFVFWTDHFNCDEPAIGGRVVKYFRSFLRRAIFHNAKAVLICGKAGCESAVKGGCTENKVINFPYVVDATRIRRSTGTSSDIDDIMKIESNKKLILFSGRLIERKGLGVLLQAVAHLRQYNDDFFLIIEGGGPLRQSYEKRCGQLGIEDAIRFLGFRQMQEHAILLSIADIIVVPSIEDPWGIVVHEGMLLGKAVCASDAVGAAADRIRSGVNGFIFRSGDWRSLSETLGFLLSNDTVRQRVGKTAEETASLWSVERNVRILADMINCSSENSYDQQSISQCLHTRL